MVTVHTTRVHNTKQNAYCTYHRCPQYKTEWLLYITPVPTIQNRMVTVRTTCVHNTKQNGYYTYHLCPQHETPFYTFRLRIDFLFLRTGNLY